MTRNQLINGLVAASQLAVIGVCLALMSGCKHDPMYTTYDYAGTLVRKEIRIHNGGGKSRAGYECPHAVMRMTNGRIFVVENVGWANYEELQPGTFYHWKLQPYFLGGIGPNGEQVE